MLGEIVGGEFITVAALTAAGVLPVLANDRPVAEKPPKKDQLSLGG